MINRLRRTTLILWCHSGFLLSMNMPAQTAWHVINTRGHSIDPITGKIDDTESFGAFDSIIELFKPHCPRNFDNGGGSFDDTTRYVKEKYSIENFVYDPFMRSAEHNKKILDVVKDKKFDCATSMSVLNVIDTYEARRAHIQLNYDVLKPNGLAFFKIWPGNNSGIETRESGRYQSNKDARFYIDEVKHIFGENNADLVDSKTIKAVRL